MIVSQVLWWKIYGLKPETSLTLIVEIAPEATVREVLPYAARHCLLCLIKCKNSPLVAALELYLVAKVIAVLFEHQLLNPFAHWKQKTISNRSSSNSCPRSLTKIIWSTRLILPRLIGWSIRVIRHESAVPCALLPRACLILKVASSRSKATA